MASIEGNSDLEEFSMITKVDAKRNLQLSSCQSSPNKRKDSLGKIEKYYLYIFESINLVYHIIFFFFLVLTCFIILEKVCQAINDCC